ncbi:hypothetical protein HOLleu_37913 [Holothuria leucospilota]|uniref:Uncharacterized protein n=1 Tax=Holothuria leucospilota TaxID=206669 RepID=A0A9Q1BFN9_HOLLE|nr:hypothetical protein HOLleu_37913 [Holothuria leucospilota]
MSVTGDLEVERLVEVGKTLGLEAEKLQEFVEKERARLKAERDLEREERAEAREAQKETLQLQLEIESVECS